MLFDRQFYKFVLHTRLRAVCEKNGETSYIILEYTGECDIAIWRNYIRKPSGSTHIHTARLLVGSAGGDFTS